MNCPKMFTSTGSEGGPGQRSPIPGPESRSFMCGSSSSCCKQGCTRSDPERRLARLDRRPNPPIPLVAFFQWKGQVCPPWERGPAGLQQDSSCPLADAGIKEPAESKAPPPPPPLVFINKVIDGEHVLFQS